MAEALFSFIHHPFDTFLEGVFPFLAVFFFPSCETPFFLARSLVAYFSN